MLPAVTAEVEAAQGVKDKSILAITGNPPYSGISKNMGSAAQALIELYKYVDGKHTTMSYHAAYRVSEEDIFDNRLIYGDNLL